MRRTSVKGLVYAPEASNVARVGWTRPPRGRPRRARGARGGKPRRGGGEVSSRVLERGARERRRERGAGRDASRRGRRGRGTDPAACDDDDFARAASGRGDRARAARGSARDRVDAERRAERAAGEPPERRRRGEHPVARERTGRVGLGVTGTDEAIAEKGTTPANRARPVLYSYTGSAEGIALWSGESELRILDRGDFRAIGEKPDGPGFKVALADPRTRARPGTPPRGDPRSSHRGISLLAPSPRRLQAITLSRRRAPRRFRAHLTGAMSTLSATSRALAAPTARGARRASAGASASARRADDLAARRRVASTLGAGDGWRAHATKTRVASCRSAPPPRPRG